MTSAGAPAARLPPGRLSEPRAGATVRRVTSVGEVDARPARTRRRAGAAPRSRGPIDAVGGLRRTRPPSRTSACGAWSVAMQSMVPSASASRSASTSRLPRSGGAILVVGVVAAHRLVGEQQVVRRRPRAVTRTPRALASRTSRTAPAVETCAMCRCAPVSSASDDVARDHDLLGGARDGRRARARSRRALVHRAVVRRASQSSAWLMIGMPNGSAYSSARRVQLRVHHALAVVGEGDAAGLGHARPSRRAARRRGPAVTAPIGYTRTTPSTRARARM